MAIQHENEPPDTTQPLYRQGSTSIQKPISAEQHILTLRIGAFSDPGIRRKYRPNEDTILVTQGVMGGSSYRVPLQRPQPFALLVVADGMGGQGHGQEASQLATRSLVEYVTHALDAQHWSPDALLAILKAGIHFANQAVYQRNQEQQTTMGTTMTIALVSETTAYIAHVGDSRLYLYREPRGLVQLTQDHSIVASLVAEGIIAPEDIYTHPKRNLIYRSLGEESVEADIATVPLIAGDRLLLCSDGLWEMVRDRQIATILTAPAPAPEATAQALIRAALAGGGEDNVSAIVAQVTRHL